MTTRTQAMLKKKDKPAAVSPEERRRQHKGLAVLLGYWLLGIVVAYATPADILAYRWAAAFVEFMGGIVPAVNDVMPTSPIRDVVRFYLAVMWAVMPIFIGGLYVYINGYKDQVRLFREKKWFGLFFLVFTLALIYVLYTDADGSNWREQAALSSRPGLAFYYSMLLDGLLGFCAFTLLWLKNIPAVYLRKG